MNGDRNSVSGAGWVSALGLVWVVVVATGCPTYEKKYSGTFRQTNVDPVSASRAVEIDFFRYGGNASAILRFFRPNPVTDEPFGEQTFCTWTGSNQFDTEEQSFQLHISDDTARVEDTYLGGRFSSKRKATVTLYDAQSGDPMMEEETGSPLLKSATFKRFSDTPDEHCDSVSPFSIRLNFNLKEEAGENTMPRGVDYQIENPVFAVRWVGVETTGSGFQLAISDQGQTRKLSSKFDKEDNALRSQVSLSVKAPPEKVRVGGPESSYAIGHPVVVDERSSGGSPIIATALQPGRRPNAPQGANGSGKAVLFVENDLQDLSENVLLGAFSNSYEEIRAGNRPDRHFYVVDVDVDFDVSSILEMRLPRNLTEWANNRRIPMKVTDRYLDAEDVSLPRIWIQ